MKFSDIETISQGVSDYLSDNKIVDMTEIQRQTLPLCLILRH